MTVLSSATVRCLDTWDRIALRGNRLLDSVVHSATVRCRDSVVIKTYSQSTFQLVALEFAVGAQYKWYA